MRVLLFGYHAVGAACLRFLLRREAYADVVALITHEDSPDEEIWFERPAPMAEEAGVTVLTPSKEEIRTERFASRVRSLGPELILSAYYRYMIPVKVLEIAPLGGLNLHGSYLPEYRGRCPVNWQILDGAIQGGVTLHRMVAEPDAGNIIAQARVPIEARGTAKGLYDRLVPAAAELLREAWPRILDGDVEGTPQDHSRATYFGGRTPDDGRIRWSSGAPAIDRLIRAVPHPYPGAFTEFAGRRLFIWEAHPVKGDASAPAGSVVAKGNKLLIQDGLGKALRIRRIQLEGEEELGPAPFLSAHEEIIGARLGGGARE